MAFVRDDTLTLEPQNQAFNNWLRSYKMTVPVNYPTEYLFLFYNGIKPELLRVIGIEVERLGPIKVSFTKRIKLRKETNNGTEYSNVYFRQDVPLLFNSYNPEQIIEKLNTIVNNNKELISYCVERSSGWIVDRLMNAYRDFARNVPIIL